SLAYGVEALKTHGLPAERIVLIGGAAQNPAVQEIAAQVFAAPVVVPAPGEYVAHGAAKQASWALEQEMPEWPLVVERELPTGPVPGISRAFRPRLSVSRVGSGGPLPDPTIPLVSGCRRINPRGSERRRRAQG